MHKITILMIFIVSGCAGVPVIPPHPPISFPAASPLPKFDRKVLDCGRHNPEALPLCRKIREREAIMRDDLTTRDELAKAHNEALTK